MSLTILNNPASLAAPRGHRPALKIKISGNNNTMLAGASRLG